MAYVTVQAILFAIGIGDSLRHDLSLVIPDSTAA